MRKIAGYGSIICVFLFAFLTFGCTESRTAPRAVKGVLDLSSWDFDGDGIASLDGEWEIYWGRLLGPAEFGSRDRPFPTGYFPIPGYWNGYRVDGVPLSGEGCATFRLRVRLSPGHRKDLALRIEDEASAYRLWVNGSPVMANGSVAAAAAAMKPDRKIETASLPATGEYLDCVLQVSNFQLSDGGPYRRIALGTPDGIASKQNRLLAIDLLLFGVLGFIGLYHLVFYLLRKKDPSLIHFAFFCLVWSAGIPFGASSGRFITLIFPDTPWYLLARMELLTWFPVVPLFLMFFASLFPAEFSPKVTRFAQGMGTVFFIFVLFAPSRTVGLTEVPYQVFSIAIAAYILLSLYRVVARGRREGGLMLAGFCVFVGTMINDILFMNLIIYTAYVISGGIAVMILFQTFALARRFARSFAAVEVLTAELGEKNVALSRVDKLKDEFLANTSHELRTPLNGIIGIAESLRSGATGKLPEKTRQNLSMIVASGKRLAGLINDILDSSRLRNRDIRLQKKALDVRALAEIVLSIMRPLAAGKPITLNNRIPDSLSPAWGDEDRLQQILYNLIGNAVKFTDRGEIAISASQESDMIEVSIADTGVGIPEGRHVDIFQPFEQADASDGRAHGGAGLGLSITKQLVELHGGTIRVESAPQQGSTFRFTLPIARDEVLNPAPPAFTGKEEPQIIYGHPIPAQGPTEDLPGFDRPVRILAVDDDPVNLQVVANHLAFRNVEVITAASGMQAVAAIESGIVPDLVLLDVMMPRMTGYEVSQWLRQRYTASEVPVIMLTAKDRPEDLAEGFARGANDYLVKPFARDELLARVVSQLKLKESYLTLRENLTLRKELEERTQVERELRLLQQTLSRMLDSVDEALLAINEEEEITFCNRACEDMLGYRAGDLLGRPLFSVVQAGKGAGETKKEAVRSCLGGSGSPNEDILAFRRSDGGTCEVHAYLSPLVMEEETVCLAILRRTTDTQHRDGPGSRGVEQSIGIVEAINRNRARLQSIKASLETLAPLIDEEQPGFLNELRAVDEALEDVGKNFFSGQDFESRRHLAAEVMTCALDYWTESTGLTKTELARQSKIWKIYTNLDGWERTQTLDRYLNIEIFPQKPLWVKVLRTADFVLTNGKALSPLRTRLEILLAKLRVQRH
jgi:two-component system, sensor histidine kinase ChiS